ncbi:hypothetical protein SAMN06272735_5032 [Streptomyces sp. TLI_55]|uniref:hypothetical protein n=1 Tax=Streptomyces sp. TLI_55 TaxID=1938861 RepID=UPI000BC65B8E|nr:hypothetical protein [Streptomyces sp. TLI_55]SNX63230.1 hypothetical protein SAMN06272735_5032 [Streptomyces sp. TLI_55]
MTPPTRTRRVTKTALGVTTAVAMVTLTACGGGSDADGANGDASASAATPQGVLTAKAAAAVVDDYEKVNNKANAALDKPLLGTVEAGQLYAMDKASYTLVPTLSQKDQKAYRSPFTYQDRQYAIPAKGTATWFAVRAKSSDAGHNSSLMVFDKVNGAYKLVLTVWAEDGEALPELALDKNGLAEAVNPDAKVGKFAPSDVGAAYEDLLETGGAKAGKNLASTTLVKQAVKTYKDSSTKGTADGIATKKFFAKPPADPSVYALRTADGGVLALFPLAHTQEILVKEAYRSSRSLVPSEEQSALGAVRGDLITDRFEGKGIAELTPTAARITALDWQHVDSR